MVVFFGLKYEKNTFKKRKELSGRQKDFIFYMILLAFPLLQFAVFYIGVNFNSVLLAFQRIDIISGTVTWTFDNIKNAFVDMTQSQSLLEMMGLSFLSYALILCIGTPLGLLFSYYIYKKFRFSGAFRVILFLPSIVSAIVMTAIFQFFVERAVPELVRMITGSRMQGLLENKETRYGTLIFYNIWVGFGTSVLMYSNGMSAISPDIVESAHLDGATGFREFYHITLPMIYNTLSTFLVTGVAGIFTNQLNLYSFYGTGAPYSMQTYGYYLYRRTQAAASEAEYPPLTAMGLIMTAVVVPLTLTVRYLLERFGPKED